MTGIELPLAINGHLLSDARLHQLVNNTRQLSRADRKAIKHESLELKVGRYSAKEESILRCNWEQFCWDYYVPNPHQLFGFFRKKGVEKDVNVWRRHMRDECGLYLRLAKGLPNRTLRSVYQRSRQLFSDLKCAKQLSESDYKELFDMQEKSDNLKEWTSIGEHIKCLPKTVREIVRNRRKTACIQIRLNRRKWSESEEQDLIAGVQNYFRNHKIDKTSVNCRGINWAEVANFVSHRSDIQCRQHFFDSLYSRFFREDEQKMNWRKKADSLKLISFLRQQNYESESDIDWQKLSEMFIDVASYHKLRKIWRQMRRSVADYKSMSFKQIVEHLYNVKTTRYKTRKKK